MYDFLFCIIYLEGLLASSNLGSILVRRLLNIEDQWIWAV